MSHSRRRISSVGTGRAPAGSVELAEARLDHFNALDVAFLVAHDAVRRGQEEELRALFLRRVGLLADGRHVLALAPVDDGHLGAHAERGARRIDGRIASADDGHFAAQAHCLLLRHRFEEEKGGNHALQLGAG